MHHLGELAEIKSLLQLILNKEIAMAGELDALQPAQTDTLAAAVAANPLPPTP